MSCVTFCLLAKDRRLTHFTNQVGQPRVLSLCSSRSGTMFISSTRLTMARGTWITENKTFTQCLVRVYDCHGAVLQQSIKVKEHLFVEDVQGFLDTNDYVPGREKDLRKKNMAFFSEKVQKKAASACERLRFAGFIVAKLVGLMVTMNIKAKWKKWRVLTLSVQKSQMSLPPINMVITFQSLWKSMRC